MTAADPMALLPPKPPLRVLHIEDNLGDARLLLEAIEESGVHLELERAANGVRAMERLHQAAQGERSPPHLVLLDLNMPGMDGLTFLRVRSRHEDWRHIPAVVLSSSRLEADVAEAMTLGAAAYLEKPSTFDQYLALARRLSRFPDLDATPPRGQPALDSSD